MHHYILRYLDVDDNDVFGSTTVRRKPRGAAAKGAWTFFKAFTTLLLFLVNHSYSESESYCGNINFLGTAPHRTMQYHTRALNPLHSVFPLIVTHHYFESESDFVALLLHEPHGAVS